MQRSVAAGIKEQAWERTTETKREGSTVVWEDVGRARQMRPHQLAWVFDLYLKISWKLLKCFKVEKWQKAELFWSPLWLLCEDVLEGSRYGHIVTQVFRVVP